VSTIFALPRFQLAAGVVAPARALPDLALAASPLTPGYVIVRGDQDLVVGGTSAGAPSLAGVLALLNQRLVQVAGAAGLGQLTPLLHRLAAEGARGLRPPVFRDIVTGDIGDFGAGPGFDLATGWGAPRVDAFADALEAPGPCEPAIGCMIPARGARRRACAGEWLVERGLFTMRRGIPLPRQTCRDGDPQCDGDGAADGRCTVPVALCLDVFDFRTLRRTGRDRGLPVCGRGLVRRVRLTAPRPNRRDPSAAENRAALEAAVDALPLPTRLDATCTAAVALVIPAPGRTMLAARVEGSRGPVTARVALRCTAG
jgi:hypothetical protein